MGKVRAPLDPIADLQYRLAQATTDKGSAYWSRQLEGAPAKFRGVTMHRLRTSVHAWWMDNDLEDTPASVGKRIGIALIEKPMVEDKVAGMIVFQELLGDSLRAADLSEFARLFSDGHLAEFNVVDWFVERVLITLLDRELGRVDSVRALAQWRGADTIWQRRAACLAFTRLAAQGDEAMPGLTTVILTVCATVVWSHERFDQTAVGSVLRELSAAEPVRVENFFRTHARFMSKECARCAVEKMPASRRLELLAHHKRATTIRKL
jgi:hypothetical protein